jgi:hypothetical protein
MLVNTVVLFSYAGSWCQEGQCVENQLRVWEQETGKGTPTPHTADLLTRGIVSLSSRPALFDLIAVPWLLANSGGVFAKQVRQAPPPFHLPVINHANHNLQAVKRVSLYGTCDDPIALDTSLYPGSCARVLPTCPCALRPWADVINLGNGHDLWVMMR